jgi:hypothetical protein
MAVVHDQEQQAVASEPLNAGRAALRAFPYPYRAALAICSDIDETQDSAEFLAIQRFLNTEAETSMGRGVGLEIGNSFYFYDKKNEFSYFTSDKRAPRLIVEMIHAGYIDCLHSYGNAATQRYQIARALDTLDQHNCKLDVWINHFGAPSNLCRKFEYMLDQCRGDDPQSDVYHTDLTLSYGIQFAWVGATTRVIGQAAQRARTLSPMTHIVDPRHPIASTTSILKEVRKRALGMRGDERFIIHRHNRLIDTLQLTDGRKVHEFLRYCNHPVDISLGATSRGLAYAIAPRVLKRLVEVGGYMLVYTHLSKNSDCGQPIAPETVTALRHLADEQRNGRILVTTTSRLLNYHRAHRYLACSQRPEGGRLRIDIERLDDPIFGPIAPTRRHVQGLTFYVSDPSRVDLYVGGAPVSDLQRNPADESGRASVTIPFAPLQFPV